MGIRYRIDRLEDVDESLRPLYTPSGAKFVLAIDGVEKGDVMGLRVNNERLLADNRRLRERLRAAEGRSAQRAKLQTENPALAEVSDRIHAYIEEQAHRLEGLGAEDRERVHTEILGEIEQRFMPDCQAAMEAPYNKRMSELNAALKGILVDGAVTNVLRELARPGSDEALRPHLVARLDVELGPDGGVAGHKVIVKGADGQPSDMSIDALVQEFRDNPVFAPVVRGVDPQAAARQKQTIDALLGRGGSARQVTREQFDQFNAGQRASFMQQQGQISDS